MKKVLILLVTLMLSFQTACSTKKEEANEEEKQSNNLQTENKVDLNEDDFTEEDLKKITTVIETEKKDNKTTIVKITYTNESSKEYKIQTIKLIATEDNQEIMTTTKKFNEKVAPSETKTYELEINISNERIENENVTLNWEVSSEL